MSKAKEEYDYLFAWYKPEENTEVPNWMRVVYNRIKEIESEKAELMSMLKEIHNQLPTFEQQRSIGNLLNKFKEDV